MPKTKFPAVISTFCLCFLFWLLLTWSFTAQEMIAGAVVSLAAALFASKFFIHENAFWLFNPAKLGALIAYVFTFLGELVKANLDVARRVFGGCKDVNPGIVKVPVNLKGDYAQAMLANSITLTPGTITVENQGKDFLVHCFNATYATGMTETDLVKQLIKMEAIVSRAKEGGF